MCVAMDFFPVLLVIMQKETGGQSYKSQPFLLRTELKIIIFKMLVCDNNRREVSWQALLNRVNHLIISFLIT